MVVAERLRDISEVLATAVGSDTVNSIGVSGCSAMDLRHSIQLIRPRWDRRN
jgi:hypothetical protein